MSDVNLTSLERDCLRLIAEGAAECDLVQRLGVEQSAVRSALASAQERLGAPNLFSAVAAAIRKGMIPIE